MVLTPSQREMWETCYLRGFKSGFRYSFEAHGLALEVPVTRPRVPDGLADLCADPRQMFHEGWVDGRARGHLKMAAKNAPQA